MKKEITTKRAIMSFKKLYDMGGLDACGHLLLEILKENPSVKVARKMEFMINVLYKIDTCTNDCWDNLKTKKHFACECNDEPILLSFDDNNNLKEIAES